MKHLLLLTVLVANSSLLAQDIPDALLTVAERSTFQATSMHAEVVELCQQLAKASPRIKLIPDAAAGTLAVQDNGIGFSEPSVHRAGSHGLLGIRERAYMLGGHLETANAPAGGARVTVRLPLRAARDGGDVGKLADGDGARCCHEVAGQKWVGETVRRRQAPSTAWAGRGRWRG